MGQTTYTFSKATDFGGSYNNDNFRSEIQSTSTILVSLYDVGTEDDTVKVVFNDTLPQDQETILNGLPALHNSTPIKVPQKVIPIDQDDAPQTKIGFKSVLVSSGSTGVCDFIVPFGSRVKGINIQWTNMLQDDYCDFVVILSASITNPTATTQVGTNTLSIDAGKAPYFNPSVVGNEARCEIFNDVNEFIDSIAVVSVSGTTITLAKNVSQEVLPTWTVRCSPSQYVYPDNGFGLLNSGHWDYLVPKTVSKVIDAGNLLCAKIHCSTLVGNRTFVANFICQRAE